MIRRVVAIFVGVFCLMGRVQAEELSYLAKAMPRLEATLALYAGSQISFSSKLELDFAPSDGRAHLKIPATIYYSQDFLRLELEANEAVAKSKAGGENTPITFIYNAKDQSLFVVESGKQSYRSVRMSDAAYELIAKEKKETRLIASQVGVESIRGQAAIKSQGVVKRAGKDVSQATVWYPQGGVQVPLKIVTSDTNQVTTLTFSAVQSGAVGADKFQLPAHFKKLPADN
jgi:hypothetical protein